MARGIPTRKRKAAQIEGTIPNTEEKERKFHRKKQGVTKTNNAAIKALIRQNQVNSPLLKLAPEIREKILTYLIGDQVLHLHHSDSVMFNMARLLEDDTWNKTKPASILYHICQADTSRAHGYDQIVNDIDDEASAEDFAAYYVENPNKRHGYCGHLVTIKEERNNVHLSLEVLGTCRQLYEEANHLLWSTNTFTFNEPDAFELFFSSLNPAQKRKLTKLGFFAPTDTVLGGFGLYWEKAFRSANLRMLQGLTALNLWFEKRIHPLHLTTFNQYQRTKSRFWRSLEGFAQFRMLPLKQVFVTISDDVGSIGALEGMKGDIEGRWTAVQKIQFEREWEEKLLDADPAATTEAEEDAAEVDAREASDRLWADFLRTGQDDVGFNEDAADAAAASLEEAKLEPARVSSSMQTGIEYIIEEREDTAMYTSRLAVAARGQFERLKVDLPRRIERDAVVRKADREARKRRQVVIKSRATATSS